MSRGVCTGHTPEPVKLSELRVRTDQQLLKLVHSKVEVSLSLLALVESLVSDGNSDHTAQLLRRAERAVIEVKQLLAVLSEDQRQAFGATINSLQEALDHRGCSRELPRSRSASTT
jgi:hypothetical protein